MKILFVTPDRPTAERGAQTLHGIAPNGTFAWARSPRSALRWLDANRDAATVILEAEQQDRDGSQFLKDVRGRGIATRIVAVPPGCLGTWLSSRGAHGGASPRPEQRSASALAAAQARRADDDARHVASMTRTEKLTVALQQRLLELEAAIEESRQTHNAEQRAAADRLARR